MRTLLVALLSILSIMETFSQSTPTDRQPVAAGRFYSADKEILTNDISKLFSDCKKPPSNLNVRAIISPHAGYVFSGKTAATAYSSISEKKVYKNIFVIGSSHVMMFDGASVYNTGDFLTPMGRICVNREIANKLIADYKVFRFPTEAHLQEHSLEVQLPLIQYYFKTTPLIVPIIIGTDKEKTVRQIAEALKPWFTPENLFVISSDFSHYPTYKKAIEADGSVAMSIISGNPQTFLDALKKNSEKQIAGLLTSMCGWTSGLALLYLAENNHQLEFRLLDYCNSGDSNYGNKNEVVGYHAIALTDRMQYTENAQPEKEEFSFTDEEITGLFSIVRTSITNILGDNKKVLYDINNMPPKFNKPMGAFVTLKINGVLRGCIGRFTTSDPLYEVIKASAISSAFEDPRFPPLTREEYKKTEIEITVLGPLQKINSKNEIILGKHGIYIKKDLRSGTMLPQVATENKWTVDEFLGYTSRDKAGLGWDGWKDADLYIYEGVVLEENKK